VWKLHRRFSGDGTWDAILAALLAQADAAQEINWTVSVDSTINRAHQHATNLAREPKNDPNGAPEATGTASTSSGPAGVDASARAVAGILAGPTGAGSNHKDLPIRAGQGTAEVTLGLYDEPVDHGIGRSRGGLSSKIHHLVDGRGRPLVILVGPGQANDALTGDKAYSARAHRKLLRSRGIKTVIPEPSDQIRNRQRRGSRGGRPPAFDAELYKGRNVVERSFNTVKQWRALATRYDKLAIVYRGSADLRAITI